MTRDPAYCPTIDRAVAFAASKHREQQRKGSDVPYISHPFMVGLILARSGFSDAVIIAGVLHDLVEDQDVTVGDIEEAFGPEVATLVDGVTETKVGTGGARPWHARKAEQLEQLDGASVELAALKAADALHNARATICEHERVGREIWSRFKAPRERQLWYYGELNARIGRVLGAHPLAEELAEAVERLRQCD